MKDMLSHTMRTMRAAALVHQAHSDAFAEPEAMLAVPPPFAVWPPPSVVQGGDHDEGEEEDAYEDDYEEDDEYEDEDEEDDEYDEDEDEDEDWEEDEEEEEEE